MMDKTLQELQKTFGVGRIRANEPMSKHTTFKIGGPAQFYLEVSEPTDLVKAAKVTHELKIPLFIFGAGSNILVSDKGIKGLVVKNNCRKFLVKNRTGKIKNQKLNLDKALVFAESGAILNQLVRFSIEQGLGGLEHHLGMPGTVGGAIFGNANFPQKNASIGDCLYKAEIVTVNGEVKEVNKTYFKFSYDKSILGETGEILLSAVFKLTPGDKKELWEKATQTLTFRGETQPKEASAGCIFQNISLVEALKGSVPDKITSSGWLIDKAGLKGKQIGMAVISPIHANFILNLGRAKADDVVKLINLVKSEVYKKFGVKLSLEIKLIGF